MGTYTHTHIRSHLYTLVPTSLSEIEFTLRGFNFISDRKPFKKRIVNGP